MGISRKTVAMMGTAAQAQVAAELEKAYPVAPKRSKYGNKRVTIVDENSVEQKFDSRSELRRWHQLRALEKAGEITELKRQVSLPIVVNGVMIGTCRPDFSYRDRENVLIYEDVKGGKDGEGTLTPLAKWQHKLVLALYGTQVRITSA